MRTVLLYKRGYTLIEILVVVGVVSIMVALLLPAVQAARHGAWRASCQNNLHQIGLALQSYGLTHDSFPPALISRFYGPRLEAEYTGFFSIHCRLLLYLDSLPLYNSINFDVGTWPPDGGVPADRLALNQCNVTVSETSIAAFLCPADGAGFNGTGNNYRGNVGVGPSYSTLAETPDSGNGLFPELKIVRPSEVIDGLSHTVAFSERVRGSGGPTLDPERDVFLRRGIANTADQLLLACRAAARSTNVSGGYINSGSSWFWSGRERTLYNHTQAPNGNVPDCTYGGMTPAIDMATARSRHPGGVNALMGDGSLRFISTSIDQAVWRGLGTRNGSELVGLSHSAFRDIDSFCVHVSGSDRSNSQKSYEGNSRPNA